MSRVNFTKDPFESDVRENPTNNYSAIVRDTSKFIKM
jgi:hypothetical protein